MTAIIRIDDPDDPLIEAYRGIRDRDFAGRRDGFVAEGKVVLNVLFSARRFQPVSALVLESRLAGMTDTLALAPAAMPVYVATQAVMDAVAGFHVHRGILAVGRRRQQEDAAALVAAMPQTALVVALAGIANHDNMGAIFRNAAAFGADAVLLDTTCCDPLYRKAIRVSVGAALKVPYAVFDTAAAITALLADNGFQSFALSPSGEMEIGDCTPPPRAALFLGAEGDGLPPRLMARMRTLRIGMAPGFDSLNVAAASAVALHHFRRMGQAPGRA